MLVPKLRFKREDGSEYPEWEETTFGETCSGFEYGMNTAACNYDGVNKYIRITDIDDTSRRYMSENAVSPKGNMLDKYIVKPNDILFARTGASVGKAYLYKEFDGLLYYAGFLIRANVNTEHNAYFVFAQTLTYDYWNWVKLTSMRTGQQGINAQEYKEYNFFVPCLEEQQKIADFLSTVDEVIAQSEAEVQNFEQQKKAAMQKIFSQEVRFKREDGAEYPEWETDIIGNCVNVTSCKRVHQSDWTDSGVPFYRAREIVALYNNEAITPLHISIEKYKELSEVSGVISSGDLLVTGVGTIGVPYLVRESDKFYFKDGNIIWFQNTEDRVLGSFLYYTLGTSEFQTKILQDSGKGTVHTFTIANAKETTIVVPCLEEQQKIADFLSAYDEAISYAKQELEHWKQLKKGLLQQMFV